MPAGPIQSRDSSFDMLGYVLLMFEAIISQATGLPEGRTDSNGDFQRTLKEDVTIEGHDCCFVSHLFLDIVGDITMVSQRSSPWPASETRACSSRNRG